MHLLRSPSIIIKNYTEIIFDLTQFDRVVDIRPHILFVCNVSVFSYPITCRQIIKRHQSPCRSGHCHFLVNRLTSDSCYFLVPYTIVRNTARSVGHYRLYGPWVPHCNAQSKIFLVQVTRALSSPIYIACLQIHSFTSLLLYCVA